MTNIKLYDGGVTSPQGFKAAGICAGIKKDRKDMAMLYSTKPCTLAGTFTRNLVKAAPVVWDYNIVKTYRTAQACVMNSGVANACTGTQGAEYCVKTAMAAADALGLNMKQVLLASTGVIGMQLPIEISSMYSLEAPEARALSSRPSSSSSCPQSTQQQTTS